ncbi:MAG: thrombospondin type 3 repeat-containing protein [Verrucomicrobiales bacterium]
MTTPPFHSLLTVLAATAVLPCAGFAALTHPDEQNPESLFFQSEPYPWVYYNPHYGQPGHSAYKGVWRTPNAWPDQGAVVTIRHHVQLHNGRYYRIGGPQDPGIIPFPATQGGYLELNGLNLQPGAYLQSSLEILSFDGASTWSGGLVRAGAWSNNDGTISGRGRLRNKGTVTVTAPTTVGRTGELCNTNRIIVDSIAGNPGASLGIESGHYGLINESGLLPDASEAVIELRGGGTSIVNAPGGGGGYPVLRNYGVLRRSNNDLNTAAGTSTIAIAVENHADSPRNRAGTVQVDRGTLVFDIGDFSPSIWRGMKAEIAPGAQIIMRGTHHYESGTTTVTGGGVLRMEGSAGNYFGALSGVTNAILNASPGTLECAGAELRDMVNAGSLTVTAPSRLFRMTNKGHIRSLTGLTFEQSSNGTPAERSAVLEVEGASDLYTGSFLNNYGLLRKTGTGTMNITSNTTHYGGGGNLNIEVTGGTLFTGSEVYFENGSNIRVANGAEVQFNYRNYQQGGTLSFTGSGKYYLNAGAFLSTTTPAVPRTFNSAPGVFDCRGGRLDGPVTNTGEITVSAPSSFDRSFIGDNPITNAGTIRCLATSAGGEGSYSITMHALVRLPCTPTSVFAFDIAGRPSDFGNWARLLHGGQTNITYDGKLRINFGNFTPVDGDRWLVIENKNGFPPTPNGGDFTGVEFTSVPAGFTPVYEKLPGGIRVGLNAAPAPVNYNTWAAAQNFPTPAAGAFGTDHDGDGFTNGVECALGTDPKNHSSVPDMTALRKDSGGDIFFAAQFKRPAAALRPTDVQYIAERTDTLGGWTSAALVVEASPPDAQNMETLTVRPAEPMDYKNRTFVRLRVQQNP